MQSRLITEYENYETSLLSDHLALIAKEVEDAIITAGGEPGEDYDFKYVFSLAVQIHLGKPAT